MSLQKLKSTKSSEQTVPPESIAPVMEHSKTKFGFTPPTEAFMLMEIFLIKHEKSKKTFFTEASSNYVICQNPI